MFVEWSARMHAPCHPAASCTWTSRVRGSCHSSYHFRLGEPSAGCTFEPNSLEAKAYAAVALFSMTSQLACGYGCGCGCGCGCVTETCGCDSGGGAGGGCVKDVTMTVYRGAVAVTANVAVSGTESDASWGR
jgi:hypothetical protein